MYTDFVCELQWISPPLEQDSQEQHWRQLLDQLANIKYYEIEKLKHKDMK